MQALSVVGEHRHEMGCDTHMEAANLLRLMAELALALALATLRRVLVVP